MSTGSGGRGGDGSEVCPNTDEVLDKVRGNVEELLKKLKKEIYLPDDVLRKILTTLVLLKKIGSQGSCAKELINTFFAGKAPKGILLYGPPGTGKSYLMSRLDSLGEFSVIKVSGSEIISAYYGESERNLRKVFRWASDEAKRKGVGIIFIDEIDSIAPRRDLVRGELEPRLVGQLLTLMDGINKEGGKDSSGFVVVIASTNRIWALDPALRRPGRFDLEIEIGLPDGEVRKGILRIYLCKSKELLSDDIVEELRCGDEELPESSKVFNKLAEVTEGFSGADIFHLVREAISRKVEEGNVTAKISLKELVKQALRMRPSILRGYEVRDVRSYCGGSGGVGPELCREYGGSYFMLITAPYGEARRAVKELLCTCLAKEVGRVIEVSAPRLRSRWFGETEERLREVMDKFLRLSKAALIIYSIEALADRRDENLVGVRAELTHHLSRVEEANEVGKKLVVIATASSPEAREYLDSAVKTYFKEVRTEVENKATQPAEEPTSPQ